MALERKTISKIQTELFDNGPAWQELWWGMPEFHHGDARPQYKISLNIYTWEDLQELGKRLNLSVTKNTNSLTFPQEQIDKPSEWEYVDESS